MSPVGPEIEFDPFDERFFDDPYPAYARLRRQAPAFKRSTPRSRVWPHYWMLSRAQDVNDALADWRTFSSARGTLIDTDIRLIPINLFNMDLPRHDEHRAILARIRTPTRVAALEPHIGKCAGALAARDRADLMKEFAMIVPGSVAAHVMGISEAMHDRLAGVPTCSTAAGPRPGRPSEATESWPASPSSPPTSTA